MPHITEELFQMIYQINDNLLSIHSAGSWPNILNIPDNDLTDIKESECKNLLEILELVRKIKARDNLSIKAQIDYIEYTGLILSDNLISDLKNVTSAKEIKHVENLTSNIQNLHGENVSINVKYTKD